jgi:peroxiredoxin
MKKYLKHFLVLFLIFFFAASSAQAKNLGAAADFSLQDLNNTTYSLSSYKGKPVVLFFWTTWCPFCRKALGGELKDISLTLESEGFQIFAIDIEEQAYKVENFISSHDVKFTVLLDKDGRVASAYAVLGVPTYVLINKKGEIVFKDNYFPKETYKNLISE